MIYNGFIKHSDELLRIGAYVINIESHSSLGLGFSFGLSRL